MPSNWYFYKDGKQHGPFSWKELCQKAEAGSLDPADLVWAEGMADRVRADTVKGLHTPPARLTGTGGSRRVNSRRKRTAGLAILIAVIALVLLGGIFYITGLLPGTGTKEETARLEAELPGETWESIAVNFTFDPEETR